MFERIKKALSGAPRADASPSTAQQSRLSEWAGLQGLDLEEGTKAPGFQLSGKVGAKTWRLESGRPSRDFIKGEELRARADLGLSPDVAVMVMNRPLMEALEHKAFKQYTNGLQTTMNASLSEEMRWLTMYEAVKHGAWGAEFQQRMAVVAHDPAHAVRWLDSTLTHGLLHWPSELTVPQSPLVLTIARGKAYLRMQYQPADIPTLEHAVRVFVCACESALSTLSVDIQT